MRGCPSGKGGLMRALLTAGIDVRSKWCDVLVGWSSVTSFEKFKIEGRQTAN